MIINFENIFAESFDTFRAFRDLKVDDVGDKSDRSPNTIWQTLNHLILWQNHQLKILTQKDTGKQFWELDSWIKERQPKSQHQLDNTVESLGKQIDQFYIEIKKLRITDSCFEEKIKAIHEAANHLAFHLGEIIHLRRILGNYPMPDQMKEFPQ